MSFPKYPEYKDSGVEWLGEVPAHWRLDRSDAHIESMAETIPAERLNNKEVFHYSIPVVQDTGDGCHEDGSDIESSKLLVTKKQVLVSKLNPRKGTVCLAAPQDVLTVCSGEFVPLSSQSLNLDFLLYLVRTTNYRFRLESMVESATRSHQRASPSDIAKFRWAFPPEGEQAAIATFLDHETARIDALVDEQQRLIELLKEKRQAVISHAVTKGLDPDVPMKDSGVAWLGEVPAHWSLPKKLDHIALDENNSFVNGPFGSDLLASELQSSGVPVVYIRDLKINGYTRVSEYFVTQEKASQIAFCDVLPGDVLVAKVGDPPGLAVTYPENEPNGVVTQDVIRIRPSGDRAEPRFLAYVINSDAGRYAVDQVSVVSTRTRVSLGGFKQLRFCWPPVSEQERISDFLDYELVSITRLVNEAYKGVKLLIERRSALISAAVTGKIDVRGWQPPAGSPVPEATQTVMV